METGQMMAVLQQMPADVAYPQAGETELPVGKVDGAFAGLLQGMSNKKSVQAAVAGQAAPLKVDGMTNDVMSAFLTTVGNNDKQESPAKADLTEVKDDRSTLLDNSDLESQNVMPDVNMEQFAQLFAQLPGRMPEADGVAVSRPESLHEIPQADRGVTVQPDGAALEQIRRDAQQQQTATTAMTAGPETFSRPDGDRSFPIRESVMATVASVKGPALTVASGSRSQVDPQDGPVVTEGDKQAVKKTLDTPRADAVMSVPVERGGRQSEQIPQKIELIASVPAEKPKDSFVRNRDSLRISAVMQQQQDRSPNVVDESVVLAKTSLQQTPAVVQEVTEAGNIATQSRQPVILNKVATSAAPMPIQVTAQENEPSETAALPIDMAGQPEQLQKVQSASKIVSLTTAAFNTAEGKSETVPLRIDQREEGKSLLSEPVDTGKNVVAALSGENQTSSNENETPDRDMSGNFQSHVLHQQVKTEGSLTASAASGAAQNDTSRSALAPEQVVQQVRDRLVNHETKPGSEQIVLRLSPEHFGELKVNLNLEGQRLKVEIVAENSMVRDSLMKHTDALKESLSRQNIKMDSFEVTTGGNGASDSGRGQGSWRELAQQRQHNAWIPDGGYRLAAQAAPDIAAYQVKSEHTMVDLHY